ncbi:N-acetyltransferase [Orrella sp. JC864]|uniref:N-acetyltransferase n=1 Tax=Orrella sp. JC864 TaxID=3120298 RepID=UPI00300B68F0
MRIDYDAGTQRVQAELDALQARLQARTPRLRARGLPLAGLTHLRVHQRSADGEHYFYIEDVRARLLAGYVVFNRLVDIDRALDPYVRSPHARFRPAYQRQGVATWLYRQMLDAGVSLLSGARQSAAAHALWRALGRRYPMGFVRLQGRELTALGPAISLDVFDDLHTRLLLCGAGWDIAQLLRQARRRRQA